MKLHYRTIAWQAILSAAMLGLAATGMAQQADVNALCASVKNRYQGLKTFKADLTCEIRLLESTTNRVTGWLVVEPPAKWRMHLQSQPVNASDKPTLVLFDLCDGTTRWTYDANSRTILKAEVRDAETVRPKSLFPAFDLYDERNVTLLKRTGDRMSLRLNSLKDVRQFAAVVFDVNVLSQIVEQMDFQDWKGRTSMIIRFTNMEVDKPVKAGLFTPLDLPDVPVKVVVPESPKVDKGGKQ